MPYRVSYEEDGFLQQLGVAPGAAEVVAGGGSRVLVWHTRTSVPSLAPATQTREQARTLGDTNIPFLYPLNL